MTTPPSRRQRWRERTRYRHTTWLLAAAIAVVLGGSVAAGAWWTQRDTDEVSAPAGPYVPPSSIFPTDTMSSSTSTPASPSATSSSKKSSGGSASTTSPSPTSTSSPSSSAGRSGGPTSDAPTAGVPTAGAPASGGQDAPAGSPARVQVRSAGRDVVDASLVATKLDSQKVLAPPFGTAGWYAEPGWPKPGYTGASILVGHINEGSKPDVFADLPQVKVGDVVTVTYGSGRTVKFKITRSEAASKTNVPKDDTIWDWDNTNPVLRLITCDPTTPINGGHYEGNWVVWADQMVS